MDNHVAIVQDETIRDYSDYCRVKKMVNEAFNNYLLSAYGTSDIENIIKPGMKVVIKPNLVHEMNFLVRFDHVEMENPNDCFITNWNVIKAAVEIISVVKGIFITILECPLQSCTVEKIVTSEMLKELEVTSGCDIAFIDARRTKYIYGEKEPTVLHDLRSEDLYVDIDLGKDSMHCEFDDRVDNFRVTDYPPDEMKKYHSKGVHIYRIAREILEADVIISIPKLKTHMKAGMTNAMKNYVGIVGNKECLPHHTKGSPHVGGDDYGDFSLIKLWAEDLIDKANNYLLTDEKIYYKKKKIVDRLLMVRRLFCLDPDITGSWYGNDTISRTVVDLNRIVYYGSADGKIYDEPQRTVISLIDAIVSGQGEGPMRPHHNYTGFIAVSESTAAVDAVCAELIGLDSTKIHCLFEYRISDGKYPLGPKNSDIHVNFNGEEKSFDFVRRIQRVITPPPRWEGQIEKKPKKQFSYGKLFFEKVGSYPKRIVKYIKWRKGCSHFGMF